MKKVLIFAMCKQYKHGANVIIKLARVVALELKEQPPQVKKNINIAKNENDIKEILFRAQPTLTKTRVD